MKKILLLVCFVFLSGCFQSIALLGPAITGASTGKIYQAGLSYGTNMIMLQATGKTTTEHMFDILNSKEEKLLKK
ncbi:uncharacterized protein METZ01_LOCUS102614 [marine metagenome]|uniref:Uncharacterized protein n=1 Tax=marine metagenome TaxID=408172 RepID=A0A381WB58_9ZZZZ